MAREILFREAVIGFMSGGKVTPDMGLGGTSKGDSGSIGGYCGGKDVPECSTYFGDQLERMCKTCPQ
jgi:hypothetical protein